MPETSGPRALATLERIRVAIAAAACSAGMRITVSAGACDLLLADDRHELLALADAALYWSKAHGRDRACLHDPAVAAFERLLAG
jgi:PleD family two-component response regulator